MRMFEDHGHRAHQAKMELIPGKFVPCVDTPARIDAVANALRDRKFGSFEQAPNATRDELLRVHTQAYLDFLETAWTEWCKAFDKETDGFPYVWPNWRMSRTCPKTIDGKIGYYSFDGISPITAGVWRAASGAAGVGLAAARAVIAGESISFALCRPPGHHAGPDLMGGTSYINSTALAADLASDEGRRVAIIDVDAHHGNGAQAIFWRRNDVLTVSIHGDPSYGYPYFSGYADERGEDIGEGYNVNLPLPAESNFAVYSEALDTAIRSITEFGPNLLVVALGVDTYRDDPGGKLGLVLDDYLRIGERLSSLRLPTIAVFEGGYALDVLGDCVANVLAPFQ